MLTITITDIEQENLWTTRSPNDLGMLSNILTYRKYGKCNNNSSVVNAPDPKHSYQGGCSRDLFLGQHSTPSRSYQKAAA